MFARMKVVYLRDYIMYIKVIYYKDQKMKSVGAASGQRIIDD